MFLDAFTQLSNNQAFSANAVSTNSIDLGAGTPVPDVGVGTELGVAIAVNVAADHTTGDETYQFDIITSAAADLSSPTVVTSVPILYSKLTAGAVRVLPVPGGLIAQRYLGIRFVGGGTTPTVTVDSWAAPLRMLSIVPQIYVARGYTVA